MCVMGGVAGSRGQQEAAPHGTGALQQLVCCVVCSGEEGAGGGSRGLGKWGGGSGS